MAQESCVSTTPVDLDRNDKIIDFPSSSSSYIVNHQNNSLKYRSPTGFFQSIESPRLIVAPMVDHSDLAFRMLTRRYGAHLAYTQMFNSNMFVQSEEYRADNFRTCELDRPLFVQIAGHEPEVMLQAAKYVQDHCDAIDVNFGCPQGIAKRGRYGAFLMEELDLLHDIVSTLVQGLKIPVTCKTRIYKDYDQTIKLCETLVNAGASLLTIHGRTREEKGQFVGEADWDMIRRIKEHFGSRVIIVANGGISSLEDVQRCLAVTKADGVMTSEAILENPALFCNNIDPVTGKYLSQLDLAEEYLDLCVTYPTYHMKTVRSHLLKYLYRYHSIHDELRDAIIEASTLEEFQSVCKKIRAFLGGTGQTYKNTWYNRYKTNDSDVSLDRLPRHDHQKDPIRPIDGFLAMGSWSCGDGDHVEDEDDQGVFSGLGMFQ